MLQNLINRKPENKTNTLLFLPVVIMLFLSLSLTLSPAVKYRTMEVDLRWSHWVGFIIWLICYLFLYSIIRKSKISSRTILFISIQLISGIGLTTIWRLNGFFGFRQSLWLIVSTAAASLLINRQQILATIREYKYLLLLSGLLLIIFTFIFGTYPGGNGPNLWLGVRGIFFQPSELLKIIFIIYLAAYFSNIPNDQVKNFKFILPTILLALSAILLLILQRDLGTALIFIALYVVMIFSVYEKRRILLYSFLILLLFAIIGFNTIDLIRIRFQGWVFPWGDPQSGSYQIVQSIIAIASGGIFGTGIGIGYPNLIPLSHSDFIFSAFAEEFGLFGSIGFVCVMAVILFQGLSISLHAKNRYFRYLAMGITGYLLSQSILIIGGNIRLLPITGVTLPFVSYGGSSLLVSFIAFAILVVSGDSQASAQSINKKPYKTMAAIFSASLVLIALTLGWWGMIHTNDIQHREDNARNRVANLFVKRGEILDRNNVVMAESVGSPGNLQRIYTYPPLSNTIGFFHQKFGLAGIEDEYNAYLRGIQGYPAQDVWFSYLLYDQPPEGRPIRLTIDQEIQKKTDQEMTGLRGGLVVLNADSGEVLSISTSPFFDANTLDENWQNWQENESSPLINRATQGAYPVGGLLSPILLTYENNIANSLENTPVSASYDLIENNCTQYNTENSNQIEDFIPFGCVSALLTLVEDSLPIEYFSQEPLSKMMDPVNIEISNNPITEITGKTTWIDLILGKNILRSNPLQIAVTFLPLSNNGIFLSPSLVSGVNTANAGWVVISEPEADQIIQAEIVDEIVSYLALENTGLWELTAVASDTNGDYTWYVGGTRNGSAKGDYIVALVIEENSSEHASLIGREILQYMQN